LPNQFWEYVSDREMFDAPAGPGGDKRQELKQHVAIALLRVDGEIALGDEMFQQKTPDPATDQCGVSHGISPAHIFGTASWPHKATPASK
jgi:hypothetical protein